MLNPYSPQLVRVIHEEKISRLEREIALLRMAKENGSVLQEPAWYTRAAQWVKGKLATSAPAAQARIEEPCPVTPC